MKRGNVIGFALGLFFGISLTVLPAQNDSFSNWPRTLESPARQAIAITPSDDADAFGGVTRAVYVGGAGNLNVIMADGGDSNVTFVGVTAGTVLPIRIRRVRSTSTTATSIVGLY